MIQRVNPDIIVGTESWLNDSIKNSECFPVEDYEFERRDRADSYGGIFIGIRRDLSYECEPELETECEIMWCKINLAANHYV